MARALYTRKADTRQPVLVQAATRAASGRPALRARQMLGKYRIERRIAVGGFGEVYRALDTIEGISVALKLPFAHLVTRQLLDDFRKEVRLSAGLDDPHILPIKNAQFIGDVFVVAYPLGEGTLADRMQRRTALSQRVSFAEQMIRGVAHAHAKHIIHCDVKPENFILFEGNRLRLTDFGISRLARRTVLASGSGTVGYVAPEQAMGKTGFPSDVFSLGLILYQLFSGSLPEWPFKWPPRGIDRLRTRAHPNFIRFLRRSLELDPHKRFADAQKMLSAFERLQSRDQVLAPKQRRRRRPRRAPRDWKAVRQSAFLRHYRTALQLHTQCRRCEGPMSEGMVACPWCGTDHARFRGETRHPARCSRCGRGRKPDWRFCPWCYGPGFKRVSEREYSDRAYTERCRNPGCERKLLMPFMRYCPWCRRKPRQRWKIPGVKHHCERCGSGVHPDYWSSCPWCAKTLPKR